MGPVSSIQRALIGGMGIGLLFLGLWAWRIDGLRADHLQHIETTVEALKKAGFKEAGRKNIEQIVSIVVDQRNSARSDRDAAQSLVKIQSDSIALLEQQTAEAAARAKANRDLAENTARQRDFWIKQAKASSTRTERLSAEDEVKECETVLDTLYSSGL